MNDAPIGYRLIGYTTAPVVVVPYLSKRTMHLLDQAGLNYCTSGGTVKIVTDTWPVYAPIEENEEHS